MDQGESFQSKRQKSLWFYEFNARETFPLSKPRGCIFTTEKNVLYFFLTTLQVCQTGAGQLWDDPSHSPLTVRKVHSNFPSPLLFPSLVEIPPNFFKISDLNEYWCLFPYHIHTLNLFYKSRIFVNENFLEPDICM